MNSETQISVSVGLTLAIGSVVLWVMNLARCVGKQEIQVGTLWSVFIRDVESRAVSAGVARRKSALAVTDPETRNLFKPLVPKLREWYLREGYKLSDFELLGAVDKVFGREIIETVCTPNHKDYAMAWMLACALMREA